VDFLADSLMSSPTGPTIIALGPLTNLSRLERSRPGILHRSGGVVIMGGAVETAGNVTPRAEFNFHSDPLAAAHVLGLGSPMTLVDLAACRQVGISREQAAGLSAGTSLGRLAARIVQGWFARDERRQRFEFYDPLAVALALDPGVATMRPVALTVGVTEGDHWGETTIAGEPGPIALAAKVDASRFFDLLGELLGWRGFEVNA